MKLKTLFSLDFTDTLYKIVPSIRKIPESLKAAGILVIVFTVYITFNQWRLVNQTSVYDEEIYVDGNEMVFVPLKTIMKSPFTLAADHKRVLQMIVNDYSREPSNDSYMLDDPSLDTSNWQQMEILKLLKNKKNGVFVECGALHGEYLSNTLWLEMKHGWSGVLIEPDPTSYKRLLKKNRKAWTVEACLSPQNYMAEVILKQGDGLSKITNTKDLTLTNIINCVKVQCFPLISILLALNITTIDYFSLDIEGEEVKVLETIPWDKVNITTFSVEFNHVPEGKEGLKNFMRQKGYKVYVDGSQLSYLKHQNVDLIFYHEELLGYVP